MLFLKRHSKFDWFSAGVHEQPFYLIPDLVKLFKGELNEVRPKNGYSYGLNISKGSSVLCTIFYGGPNVGSRVMVTSSSIWASKLRDFLVSNYSDRSVLLRADVCLDFSTPDLFDKLVSTSVYVADKHRLKTSTVGDWINKRDGRTLYLGSRKSPAFLRLYEKGKQLIDENPDLVRLEIEFKPKNFEARRYWFSQPAYSFWSFNKWSSDLVSRISGSTVYQSSVFCGTVHRDSDHDRALHFMIKQYRNTILNELTFNGGDPMLLINRILDFKDDQ